MKSILTALQEGRLIELPDTDKEQALRYLASIIEAVPDINPGYDVAESALARERSANTAIGKGWACPHVRSSGEGELLCAIGWNPAGIDYGAPDGEKVRLLVMYYIPDSEKNAYLKELSSLARAIQKGQGMDNIKQLTALPQVRDELLDWISASIDTALPEAKARMIKLEAKQALAEAVVPAMPVLPLKGLAQLIPLYIVSMPGGRHLVLAQDRALVSALENVPLPDNGKDEIDAAGYKVLIRARTAYQPDRSLYDCLAVKL